MSSLYPTKVVADNPFAYYELDEIVLSSAYVDHSGNGYDIATSVTEASQGFGVGTWSYYSRYSDTALILPTNPTTLNDFTYELYFRAETPDKYVLLDVGSLTTDIEIHAEISEDTGSPGDYLLKFGIGYGNWDIDIDDTHVHAFVYTDAEDFFDGEWHHLVCVWDGTSGAALDASQLTLYIDGVQRDDAATRGTHLGTLGVAPYELGGSLNVGGPFDSTNSTACWVDEIAVYTHPLTSADVVDHFNAAATIEPVYESDDAPDLITWTGDVLLPAYEIESLPELTKPVPDILISCTTTVTAAPTVADSLAGRIVLDESGSLPVDLSLNSLEAGEPNSASFTKTAWFELALSPESTLQERVFLSAAASTGKVAIYKDPTLDDADDIEESTEDELVTTDPTASEPKFSDLVLVQTAAADQIFTLDPDYSSSYFLQVGMGAGGGLGTDFILSWGDASPNEGGFFDAPIEVTGEVGMYALATDNAWIESGEPNSTGITETRSVWLKWTAPTNMTATFYISPTLASTFAAEVYTGTLINALSQVTSGSATGGETVTLSFSATSGTEYYVRVATTEDATVYFQWRGPQAEFVANDPSQHIMVTVHAGVVSSTIAGHTYAPNEKIAELPNRKGLQFQESLNVPGSGSITIQQNDPVLRAFNPSDWPLQDSDSWTGITRSTWDKDAFQLLSFGHFVKFWMTKADGSQTCVHAFIIKQRDTNVVGQAESADRTITVSGPSVHYLLNDFAVLHDNYPDTRKSELRAFNWASVSSAGDSWAAGGWFDATGNYNSNRFAWNHPINADGVKNPPGWSKHRGEEAKKRPKYALATSKKPKWPDLRAKWLWISQNKDQNHDTNFPPKRIRTQGLHYYRTKAFNITKAQQRLRFSAHSDTYYEVWLDGELFMTGNGNENYVKYKKKKTTLARSGNGVSHTIAVYVEDRKTNGTKKKPKDFDHNDAFILTVQALNNKGKVKKTLINTNSSQWYAWHGDTPPAWSRAAILRQVIKEAKQRGNQSAQAISIASNFGQYSAEGQSWADNKKRSMTIQIGTSALDLAASFSESNSFDVWIDPDTLQLYAFQGGRNMKATQPRGSDRTNNVALVPGYNLLNWSVSETDDMKNFVVVQYARGVVYAYAPNTPNGDSRTKFGTREGYLEFGDTNERSTAEAMAEAILLDVSEMSSTSGSQDIVGHFNEDYNGSVIAVLGAVPFLDWNVGDCISSPGSNGALRAHRVLSLSCTEDDNGNLTFDPELQGV